MDPVLSPIEPVDISRAHRDSVERAMVVGAWVDHHDEIFAFLVRSTRDRDVAEDLLQEAFLRLTREVAAGRGPDNVRAWLYRVAANLTCSRGRRISSAFRWLAGTGRTERVATVDPPETEVLDHEGYGELRRALDALAPAARAALLLSSEGFSGAEIAAAIGRSPMATRTLMSRARIQVRQRLAATEAIR